MLSELKLFIPTGPSSRKSKLKSIMAQRNKEEKTKAKHVWTKEKKMGLDKQERCSLRAELSKMKEVETFLCMCGYRDTQQLISHLKHLPAKDGYLLFYF